MNTKKKNSQYPYELGYKCFYNGKTRNPYAFGTYMHKEWTRGFDTAYMENLTKGLANAESAEQSV